MLYNTETKGREKGGVKISFKLYPGGGNVMYVCH